MPCRSIVALLFLTSLAAARDEPENTRLFEWERGVGVRSTEAEDRRVFLWFYEWNMFEAMTPGQHTRGNWTDYRRAITAAGEKAEVVSDALRLEAEAARDGAELRVTVKNTTDHTFPEIAAIIPCFNPGPADERVRQFANTKTYFLSPDGLRRLEKREIHFNRRFAEAVEKEAENGEYVWSSKWPRSDVPAVGGLIVRESTDGQWACGIAWEEFLSAQGHNPWECMHLSVRIGPLKPGESRTLRGRIYLLEGTKEDVLARYRADFEKKTGDDR